MEVRRMGPRMRVLEGGWERGQSPLEAAYDHFRLELRGNLVSKNTLEHYDYLARPLFDWLELERPDVRSFETLGVEVVRAYRAALTERHRPDGRPLQPRTLLDAHKALLTFFRWARTEGYAVDPRLLELKRPKVPSKEPTVYHIFLSIEVGGMTRRQSLAWHTVTSTPP
jgi:site-specific recombinase XerD